ncbi:MAG: hypothetical protein ACK512_03585, partial [Cyanobium sp.]
SGVSDADYAPLGGKGNQPTASGSYASRPQASSRPEGSRPASRDGRPGAGAQARDNSSRFDD